MQDFDPIAAVSLKKLLNDKAELSVFKTDNGTFIFAEVLAVVFDYLSQEIDAKLVVSKTTFIQK